ncbi:MAG: sugar transferase [Anaeroplasmataceae bacterium]|nr:sugar transferase [Anaeroplasmataceae bacterium]
MRKKDRVYSFKGNEFVFKHKPIYAFLKRCIDFLGAFIAIILLSWLLIILSILVKCTSRGPVIYKSQRIGKGGKPFTFYKFRSMRVGAEAELKKLEDKNEVEGGIIFKMHNDPRITKFGKFLRKTSLDELPQLFNILNGTMSIVGPRPCTVSEYEKMLSHDEYKEYSQLKVLVPQGLTCIWQCSGRSNTTFEQQMQMDIDYIKKRGFWFDVWLVLKTVPAVLFSKGAE